MSYFAMFCRVGPSVFRLDTRIYLSEMPTDRDDGQCIAAVVGKNPGSARWTRLNKWGPLVLGKDKMLPYVRNRFIEAYRLSGNKVPRGAYVRVWNLFYLCNENLNDACREFAGVEVPLTCDTEACRPPITWFVWGGPDGHLTCHKKRFERRAFRKPFYFDKEESRIVCTVPTSIAFAKHTQGLPKQTIEEHLAEVL